MSANQETSIIVALLFTTLVSVAVAEDFSIDWNTIDGGGGYSAGGAFELEGTIGQSDAGYLAGGTFELDGGYWGGAIPFCRCLGDMNNDSLRDGRDIEAFIRCVLNGQRAPGATCQCADADGSSEISIEDIDVFVASLLDEAACP